MYYYLIHILMNDSGQNNIIESPETIQSNDYCCIVIFLVLMSIFISIIIFFCRRKSIVWKYDGQNTIQ